MRNISIFLSIVWLALANIAAADDADRLQDPDVRGNFVGAKWYANWETSRRPGRVVIETDPKRVRTGPNSIRLHLKPGDCGKHLNFGEKTSKDGFGDCDSVNERVGISPDIEPVSGIQHYAFSIMLDKEMYKHRGDDINLFQWYSYSTPTSNGGACVNIMLDTRVKRLLIDDRCWTGNIYHGHPRKVYLDGPVFDIWHEFVVTANWSDDNNKGYFKLIHNGKLAHDYNGYTMANKSPGVVEAAFIYRYQGINMYSEPSTVWFDDIIKTRNINVIKKVYDFDETLLLSSDKPHVLPSEKPHELGCTVSIKQQGDSFFELDSKTTVKTNTTDEELVKVYTDSFPNSGSATVNGTAEADDMIFGDFTAQNRKRLDVYAGDGANRIVFGKEASQNNGEIFVWTGADNDLITFDRKVANSHGHTEVSTGAGNDVVEFGEHAAQAGGRLAVILGPGQDKVIFGDQAGTRAVNTMTNDDWATEGKIEVDLGADYDRDELILNGSVDGLIVYNYVEGIDAKITVPDPSKWTLTPFVAENMHRQSLLHCNGEYQIHFANSDPFAAVSDVLKAPSAVE